MGCWHAPVTTKDAKVIRKLMMEPLAACNAIDVLYHLIGDDTLADHLDEDNEDDGNMDVRPTVLTFLQTWFGENGDDKDVREKWNWRDDFEDGALIIFKDMLTDWNQCQRFPADKASDGSTVMTPRQLANYLQKHIEDLAIRQPSRASKIFRHIFPEFPITSKKNGTFHVDFDVKVSVRNRK